MPNAISRARKRLFSPDPDVRPYAAADTAYDQDEYVAEHDEDERADRRKRDLPPGLSERDAAILQSVKRRATLLDKRFKLCGARFGWTFFIAVVPVVGDALTPALGYIFVVHQARKAKIPRALTRRMLLNLAISTTIGLMPGAGAILLASYRANVRNARLLENFLAMRGERAAAKAAQSATSEETKRDASGDGNKDDGRPRKAAEVVDDKLAGAMSTSEKEKSPNTDQDDKDKNTTAAAPDSAEVPRLRPARSNLEYFQNRDSRFIEDVS